MTRPLVSVVTATYNGAAFVAETIESVLAQTYPYVEHVLVDDRSTDDTPRIVDEYARAHPNRIRLIRGDVRVGPCSRRNDALAAARGDYIAWLDHDDLWLRQKLELQVRRLESRPTAGFSYTQFETFDDATGDVVARSQLADERQLLRPLFTRGCFVASSTVLIRRAALETRGLRFRDSQFSFGDDYFLWLALSLDWEALLVDDALARLRRHPANESTRLDSVNTYLWSLDLLDEFVETFPDARAKLGGARRAGVARHRAAAAEWELTNGRLRLAALHAAHAALLAPVAALRYARRRALRAGS